MSQAELAERLNAVVPDGTEAVTGAHRGQGERRRGPRSLKFVSVLFMIFAGIALFVGSFIIWNTFTMIVTQRSREIALLRAIGATRRQVMRSLLVEAVVVGLGASAVGIALGRRRRQGAERADGRRGLQPAEHVAADRAAHRSGSRCSSALSSRSSRRWCRPVAPPRCCRSRRCASRPRAPSGRRCEARPGRSRARRGRCRRDALGAVRRGQHEALRARPGGSAGRRDDRRCRWRSVRSRR